MQTRLDAVIEYLPSPIDVPPIKGILDDKHETEGERKSSDDEPFAALAFKIATDPFVGNSTGQNPNETLACRNAIGILMDSSWIHLGLIGAVRLCLQA